MEHHRGLPGDDPGPDHVEAELNYVRAGLQRPVVYAARYAQGRETSSLELAPTRVRIANLRRSCERLSLATQGFELHRHRSAVRDFADDDALRAVYYPEATLLLQRASAAERVLILGHTRYHDGPSLGPVREQRALRLVHNDQTPATARARLREAVGAAAAQRFIADRFAIVHVWRALEAGVQAAPLALCDGRSIAMADLVYADLMSPHEIAELCLLRANPRQRWGYVHALHPDEVVLFKAFDARAGATRQTAHTAFDGPFQSPYTPRGRSIELQALVCWA